MTRFQKEFKKLRIANGLTQEELAKALKISRSAIGMYEQGKREPDFEILEQIADYFNVKMSLFLEGHQSDCDLYLKCYQKPAYCIVQKFLRLDRDDQIRVGERIDFLLEDEKYQKKESTNHSPLLMAAHERTDIDATDDMLKHDLDIMTDEEF